MSRPYRMSEKEQFERAARMKALNADPAFKEKAAARMKALHADPAFKEKAAARMKALHADPAFKARMKALHADPAFKEKAAARMKALNADPAFKEKLRKAADSRLQGLSVKQLRDYYSLRDRGVEPRLALRSCRGARA